MAGPGPGDPDEHYDFLFKLVLVGDASVGKTCVVQRFKTGAFSERQSSTIGVDFTMKTLEIQGKRVKVVEKAAEFRCLNEEGQEPWKSQERHTPDTCQPLVPRRRNTCCLNFLFSSNARQPQTHMYPLKEEPITGSI
ncbi:RAB43, member RAS oncogene family [Phyllostomus discolor]|uniref:RAB43, member RAS oncogene family n=1 Tax=Phyllostomus discolor TaxID=89673 RepID=A0A833ZCF5_9CHIR|nr:RAB43, member RAS oncogene family [Phyllostomus discolor]